MNHIPLKMLTGDRAKYLGILSGMVFASLLLSLFGSIFVGLVGRMTAPITDAGIADVWVMDPTVTAIDNTVGMREVELSRVRGVDGVRWAVPMLRGKVKARLANGDFQTCTLVGIDDATLTAGPPVVLEGRLADLRRADAVFVDRAEAAGKLSRPDRPLRLGDTLELNDRRAVIAGFVRITPSFDTVPTLFTTYQRAIAFAPPERKPLTFILVKAADGVDPVDLARRIERETGLGARTGPEFARSTVRYIFGATGIAQNFGLTLGLGFLIGLAVAGQTFFAFIQDNLRYFGVMKAMGATDRRIVGMVALQSATVALQGFGIGAGIAAWIGYLARNSALTIRTPYWLIGAVGAAILLIAVVSALLSVRRILRLPPSAVFNG
ncbi:ABC transporter permease [Luteitalea sp. TBR-22]|uniref:ABC transporter permease n=1 Tax=Luteitalea sp. TBR-22 TaxID=2802971 RepID=UPI001AFC439B|nr:ABC transporter permease [Luteitalea sp. TBR-22]BCS30847.1 ABC transporter permease [Luteitalea sp. TBR-22]